MVGDEQAITNQEVPVPRPGSRLKLLIPAGLLLLAAVILLRATGSILAGTDSKTTPLLAIGLSGSDRATVVEQGKRLFEQDCAPCHGARGERVAAAPLNSRRFVEGLGPRLEETISSGKGTMAAWGRDRGGPLTGNDVKAIAAYVRSDNGFLDARVAAPATATPKPSPVPTVEQRKAPPAVAHSLANLDNRCLECHSRGASLPMPVNHAGRSNSTCSFCHTQGAVTVALPVTTSAANPAQTAPVVKPAPVITATAVTKP